MARLNQVMKKTSQPLVSVIMPTYNSSNTVVDSINSVSHQSYDNWELIITDDCSEDNTVDLIEKMAIDEPRISIAVNDKNRGAGFSRNASIERASGKYIAFLDADDLWSTNKLEMQISFMEKNNYFFTFTSYQMFSHLGDGKIINAPESVSYNELLYGNVIGCLTAVYNAEALGKQRMPLIRKRQDMGLWLTLLTKCSKAYGLPDILAKYRTDSGMTQNKMNVAKYQWEFYREVVKLGLLKSSWYFFWYAINGIKKHKQ